jgi:hypothetical protein
MQNNQLPTKILVELKDDSIVCHIWRRRISPNHNWIITFWTRLCLEIGSLSTLSTSKLRPRWSIASCEGVREKRGTFNISAFRWLAMAFLFSSSWSFAFFFASIIAGVSITPFFYLIHPTRHDVEALINWCGQIVI